MATPDISGGGTSTITVGANCTTSAPCNYSIGEQVFQLTSSFTCQITAGSGADTVYVYSNSSGVITCGSASRTISCSAGGCQVPTSITGFPFGSVPWYAVTATDTTYATITGAMDKRALTGNGPRIVQGTAMDFTEAAGQLTIGVGATVGRTDTAKTWSAKQTFAPNATTSGANLGSFAGDPSSLVDGDIWYNSSTHKFRCRQNGVTSDCVGAGGSSTWGSITGTLSSQTDLQNALDAKLSLAGGTMTGQLGADNLGVEFEESDTNPTCAAGNFNIYADASENKLKKCQNGTATDLDTTGGGSVTCDPFSSTQWCLIELWPGSGVTSNTMGTHGWQVWTTGSGTYGPSSDRYAPSAMGMVTSAATGDTNLIQLPRIFASVFHNQAHTVEYWFKTSSSVANTHFQIGHSEEPNIPFATREGLSLRFVSGTDTNWSVRNGYTTQVCAASEAPAADTWYVFRQTGTGTSTITFKLFKSTTSPQAAIAGATDLLGGSCTTSYSTATLTGPFFTVRTATTAAASLRAARFFVKVDY